MQVSDFFKEKLSKTQKKYIKKKVYPLQSFLGFGTLNKLAEVYETDKFGTHFYTKHYQTHFSPLKRKKIKLLEIGVGGYDDPFSGGNSLRMWKNFFKNGQIFSIDIFDKTKLEEDRIRIFKGSQVDQDFLAKVTDEIGEIDIIIDDGSHINQHVIESFNYLFPKLKNGGIYVIEDVQTSYWGEYGGNNSDLNDKMTIMGYFKFLIDGLNHSEYRIPDYERSYFDKNIFSMHFYHNLIFVYKNKNDRS